MQKTVLVTILIFLVSVVLFTSLPLANSSSQSDSPTQVNGTINSDTIWSNTNSPYVLTGNVTISSSATLIIQAGVEINLNGSCLQADGTLIAQGRSNEKVNLREGSLLLNSNSTIENAVVNSALLITVNSSSPSISHSQIDSRIIVKGGSPVIFNNILLEGVHADAIGGPITIKNNTITSTSASAVIYIQGIHADISGNTIMGNNNKGIHVYHICSSVSIRNNKISNCSGGIHLFTGPNKDEITQNVIFNNTVGIYNRGGIILEENTIAFNEIGLHSAHLWTFENNNFINNSRYSIENNHIVDFNAFNNWWGTTNASLIDLMIFDKNDEPVLGQVNFEPFLTKPNSNAPAIPTESIITQIPEFPSLMILPLIGLAVVVVTVFRRNYAKRQEQNQSF